MDELQGVISEKEETSETPTKEELLMESFEAEPDETVKERVIGLTEMIPEKIRKSIGMFGKILLSAYQVSCDASWILFSILAVTLGPVAFHKEFQRDVDGKMLVGKSGNNEKITESNCSS